MMHVDHPVQPKEIALLQMEYDIGQDLTANLTKINGGDSIGSKNDVKLTFKGADADQSILTFEQYKYSTNTTETF
jgi:hypothetical protein